MYPLYKYALLGYVQHGSKTNITLYLTGALLTKLISVDVL